MLCQIAFTLSSSREGLTISRHTLLARYILAQIIVGVAMGKAIAGTIVMGFIGIAIALIGKHVFGVTSPWFSFNPTINVGLPQPDPAQEAARQASEAQRKHQEQLTAIRQRDERARAEAEANRRAMEAARAAEEEANARRRMRQAADDERAQRAAQKDAWRRANGGCNPPMRKQCMYANGQPVGCICTQ
ncbi:MAG: hypothetical protein AB7G08_31320 [Hyphomicrobiaceae bacterium]